MSTDKKPEWAKVAEPTETEKLWDRLDYTCKFCGGDQRDEQHCSKRYKLLGQISANVPTLEILVWLLVKNRDITLSRIADTTCELLEREMSEPEAEAFYNKMKEELRVR